MKITKWIDMGAEVNVNVDADDIRCALAEAFASVTDDRLGDPGPNRQDVMRTINLIAEFMRAITDEQLALLEIDPLGVIERHFQDFSNRCKLARQSRQNIPVVRA